MYNRKSKSLVSNEIHSHNLYIINLHEYVIEWKPDHEKRKSVIFTFYKCKIVAYTRTNDEHFELLEKKLVQQY